MAFTYFVELTSECTDILFKGMKVKGAEHKCMPDISDFMYFYAIH